MVTLEPLEERHRKPVIDIYNYYIRNTTYAYRPEEVDYDYFDKFIDNARRLCGFAILNEANSLIGFCQLKPYSDNPTFEKTVELTYFLAEESTGQGVGAFILEQLLEAARKKGKTQVLVSISGENLISQRFHMKNGFRECGRFRRIGTKLGREFDIVYMQKHL